MPARLLVSLSPKVVPDAGPPRQTGPAVHAAVLDALRRQDPGLATDLHDRRPPSPYALTTLRHEGGPTGSDWTIQVGLADDGLIEPFASALAAAGVLRFGQSSFLVDEVRVLSQMSFGTLAALDEPTPRWRLRFHSPTALRQGRRVLPFPLPDLLLGALLSRWQHFADPADSLPPLRQLVEEHLVLGRYELRTERHLVKPGGRDRRSVHHVGFVGDAELAAIGSSQLTDAQLSAVTALLWFGAHVGVGDRTPVGMGQMTPLPLR